MTNANDARRAHKILDDLFKGNMVLDEEREFLRRALPELSKQKTLAEITSDVYIAWYDTIGSDWDKESYGDLDAWLHELHTHLIEIEYTPAAEPAKPAHPEFLETEADYENVPEGTILTMDGLDTAWVKKFDGWTSTGVSRERTSKELGYVRRRVLRWGWSE